MFVGYSCINASWLLWLATEVIHFSPPMRHSTRCLFRLERFSFMLKLYLSTGSALNLNALRWINTGAQMRTRPQIWDFGCGGFWWQLVHFLQSLINIYKRKMRVLREMFWATFHIPDISPPSVFCTTAACPFGGLAMCTGGSICSRLFWNQLESACFPGALQMGNSALVVLSSNMQALLAARHWRWLWLHSDKCENGDWLRNLGHVALCLHTHTYTSALILPWLLYHNNSSFVKDDSWHVGISFMEFCVLELLWRPGINRLRPGIEFHQRETTAWAF